MSTEERFTFSYYTPTDPDPEGVPFKTRYDSLVEAAADAWRMNHRGGRAVSIVEDDTEILSEEALKRVCERVDALDGEQPGRDLRAMVARALDEMVRRP